MKKSTKKIIGVMLLLLSIAFFIVWEFVGRKELLHNRVVVLNQDVEKGTLISYEMLTTINIETEILINGVIVNQQSIIGLEARHYIPANTQLVDEYFDTPAMVLADDEKILKLPNEWIFTFPDTLRRKDIIYLYAIKTSEGESENTEDNEINTKENKKIIEEKSFIFSTTVAYVKDNANREVESLDLDRLTGSSSISSIEIIITDKEFRILEGYALQGYQFAIMYQ